MVDSDKKDMIYLRNYSKVIFFWPLLFISIILWMIQLIIDSTISMFGYFWVGMFFINIFIISFDFPLTRVFIMILIFAIVFIFIMVLVLPIIELPQIQLFNMELSTEFYLSIAVILAFILIIAFLNTRLNYWILERNEIYHKKGLFSDSERYPIYNLRIRKSIPDVFEFLFLRAGLIELIPGAKGEIIHLPTILNVNKKAKKIDELLSHLSVGVNVET
ncbi:MAG: hypothetical protein KGD63_06970 [Candidatus Lokiarchaeota archaeon]|nr:hypothetical protein [Candidatus Lokiarchaeota archaeon]